MIDSEPGDRGYFVSHGPKMFPSVYGPGSVCLRTFRFTPYDPNRGYHNDYSDRHWWEVEKPAWTAAYALAASLNGRGAARERALRSLDRGDDAHNGEVK